MVDEEGSISDYPKYIDEKLDYAYGGRKESVDDDDNGDDVSLDGNKYNED